MEVQRSTIGMTGSPARPCADPRAPPEALLSPPSHLLGGHCFGSTFRADLCALPGPKPRAGLASPPTTSEELASHATTGASHAAAVAIENLEIR